MKNMKTGGGKCGGEISRGWHRAYIALESNLGDKKAYPDEVVENWAPIHWRPSPLD